MPFFQSQIGRFQLIAPPCEFIWHRVKSNRRPLLNGNIEFTSIRSGKSLDQFDDDELCKDFGQ